MLDQSYTTLKNMVIKAERRVLNVLGFCVHVKHPHKVHYKYPTVLILLVVFIIFCDYCAGRLFQLITAYVKALQCSDDTELIQLAW